ncbi:MAG: MazG family protein [Firmicutes bacterium]|nr:MazG family protein [Bacillota bacterium]
MDGGYTFDDLCGIVDILVSENGCPWDRAQTHGSIRDDLIEESYEAADAIDKNDMPNLCEELGDVLFDVLLHCKLAERDNSFTTADVTAGAGMKMVRRHPHIFAGVRADTPDQVIDNWDRIKKAEHGFTAGSQTLRAVAKALPALSRAEKVQKRAEKASGEEFGLMRAVAAAGAELARLKEAAPAGKAPSGEDLSAVLGALLFHTVAISRKLNINAEFALTNATETFINNFEDCEKGMKPASDLF